LINIALGLGLGIATAVVAYRLRYATFSGTLALFITILTPFALASWMWGIPVVLYFLSDLLASRYQSASKRMLGERFEHDAQRGWPQIVARTSWSMLILGTDIVMGHVPGLYVAFVGALAASLSDAWATELGALSLKHPRLITSGRSVKPGSAGAVTPMGLVASLVGAWLMGVVSLGVVMLYAWLEKEPVAPPLLWLPLAASVGGLLGSLTDSLLGAAAQRISYCEDCQERTEHLVHHCGCRTVQVRGWSWLDNERINWVICVIGAALATGLAQWLAETNMQW